MIFGKNLVSAGTAACFFHFPPVSSHFLSFAPHFPSFSFLWLAAWLGGWLAGCVAGLQNKVVVYESLPKNNSFVEGTGFHTGPVDLPGFPR